MEKEFVKNLFRKKKSIVKSQAERKNVLSVIDNTERYLPFRKLFLINK